MHALTRLRVYHVGFLGSDFLNAIALPSCARLQQIDLQCLDPRMLGTTIFEGITKLRIGSMWAVRSRKASNILDVLDATRCLVTLQLEEVEDDPSATSRRLTLPLVTCFAMTYTTNASASIAQCLILPSLARLRIQAVGPNATAQAFFDKAPALIRVASVIEMEVRTSGPSDFWDILAAAQRARELDLRSCQRSVGRAITDAFTQRGIRMEGLTALRLPFFVDAASRRALLAQSSLFHPEFLLTTGMCGGPVLIEDAWKMQDGELVSTAVEHLFEKDNVSLDNQIRPFDPLDEGRLLPTPPRMNYMHNYSIWRAQLQYLYGIHFGPDARRVLSLMSAQQLFSVATASRTHYLLVAAFLDFSRDHNGEEEEFDDADEDVDGSETEAADSNIECTDATEDTEPEFSENDEWLSEADEEITKFHTPGVPLDRISALPVDVGLQILNHVHLAHQVALVDGTPRTAPLVAQGLQQRATRILRRFHLRFWEVRLMQTASGCIISGSTMVSFLHLGRRFKPADLDIYTGRGKSFDIVRFLKHAAKYKSVSCTHQYDVCTGIGKVCVLKRRCGHTLNVIESLTDNPYDAVTHFHSSCVFAGWDAHKMWFGYSGLTMRGVTLTSPTLMPGDGGLKQHQRMWSILRKYSARGFTFALADLDTPHTCGEAWDCPVTPRRSGDGGCLTLVLPSWPYDADYVDHCETTWTLGGTGCSGGLLAGNAIGAGNSALLSDWRRKLRWLLAASAQPERETDYSTRAPTET
ncbi:hypothetical protein C8R43DRAFT_1123339 [Mycena crocata]|nr:hypothetical protein C8R43DRAFT_1123339 [Mycena crocata]